MDHADIWRAIDALATRHNLTASGLARAAGLDPTTFNKSKRIALDGKLRWPSTESLTRALAAVGASFDDFAVLLAGTNGGRAIPIVSLGKAGADVAFDADGFPVGAQETVRFPGVGEAPAYALEISGAAMAPVFRDGDIVIVQPGAPMRRGDRALLRTKNGELIAAELGRRNEQIVEIIAVNRADPPRALASNDVAWIARIIWASQ